MYGVFSASRMTVGESANVNQASIVSRIHEIELKCSIIVNFSIAWSKLVDCTMKQDLEVALSSLLHKAQDTPTDLRC